MPSNVILGGVGVTNEGCLGLIGLELGAGVWGVEALVKLTELEPLEGKSVTYCASFLK